MRSMWTVGLTKRAIRLRRPKRLTPQQTAGPSAERTTQCLVVLRPADARTSEQAPAFGLANPNTQALTLAP